MMNKKEQATFDEAKKAVYVAKALNWTAPVPKDLPVPRSGETRGFVFNSYNDRIDHALSGPVTHATSYEPPKKTSSQRGISMYSTRLLALRGLRAELEIIFATRLAAIDMEIERAAADAAQ